MVPSRGGLDVPAEGYGGLRVHGCTRYVRVMLVRVRVRVRAGVRAKGRVRVRVGVKARVRVKGRVRMEVLQDEIVITAEAILWALSITAARCTFIAVLTKWR